MNAHIVDDMSWVSAGGIGDAFLSRGSQTCDWDQMSQLYEFIHIDEGYFQEILDQNGGLHESQQHGTDKSISTAQYVSCNSTIYLN